MLTFMSLGKINGGQAGKKEDALRGVLKGNIYLGKSYPKEIKFVLFVTIPK